MQPYFNNVQDRKGNAIPGAFVQVLTAAGAVATIYSDNGVTATSNPLTTDADGEFVFYASNGEYQLIITSSLLPAAINVAPIFLFDPQDAEAGIQAEAIVGLNATAIPDGTVFYAKGRDTANDGGGGTFTYSAGSVATVDNGIVFAPAVGTGRFFREGYTVFGFNGNVNILWFGAKVNDSTTVVTTAIQAAMNTGRPAYVPPTSSFYRITAGLNGVSFSGLIGDREQSVIKLVGDTTQSVLTINGASVSKFVIDGVVLDDDESTKTATSKCLLMTNCTDVVDIGWLKCINSQSFTVEINGGGQNRIQTLISQGAATGSGLLLWDTDDNYVNSVIVDDCGGFGVQVFRGSSGNTIDNIVARNTGLEALGITVGCTRNKFGTVYGLNNGDNGISISGEDNQVGTAFIDSPAFHGACFYGMRNQIGTLRTRNVGQASAGVYAAAAGTVGFGGIAADNQVGNLFAWDDQAVPTMGYYAKWNAGSYGPWTTATVYSASTGVVNAGNSYATVAGGTSGATPPTHTSGTVSDGGVLWQYMGAAVSAANRNQVVASKGFGASISPVLDSGTGNKFAVNPQEVDVQVFLAGGTWTKPTGAKKVLVEAVGVGGSSGGGGVFAAAAGGSGGGGGGGALSISQMFDAADLTATVAVTVPAPTGAGTGAGALGAGGSGSQGGTVTFGAFLTAYGGGGGAGGTSATATGGGGSAGLRGSGGNTTGAGGGGAGSGGGTAGGAGAAGGQSNNPWAGAPGGGCTAAGVAGTGGVAIDGCQGGASGAGLTTGNAASAGANAFIWNVTTAVPGGAIATAGTTPAAVTHTKGSGGSGGGSGAAASGGAGGAGGFPGGGAGGGGSALDGGGRVGGAGALGGAGLVKVTTYF